MAKKTTGEKYVLVTTKHRGVFAGLCDDTKAEVVTLREARLCLYWSADVKGFMGLAALGPSASCRVGPAVPSIELREITSVIEMAPAARAKWEAAPWG